MLYIFLFIFNFFCNSFTSLLELSFLISLLSTCHHTCESFIYISDLQIRFNFGVRSWVVVSVRFWWDCFIFYLFLLLKWSECSYFLNLLVFGFSILIKFSTFLFCKIATTMLILLMIWLECTFRVFLLHFNLSQFLSLQSLS